MHLSSRKPTTPPQKSYLDGMTPKSTKLPKLRAQAKLSQAALGKLLGNVPQSTVKGWESRGQIPTKWIPKLTALFQVQADELLDIPTPKPPADLDRRTLLGTIYTRAAAATPDQQRAILQALDLLGIPKPQDKP